MDCARTRSWMLDGGNAPSPEVQRHLEECPACKSLFADGGDLARQLSELQARRTSAPSFDALASRLASEGGFWARLAELPSRVRWGAALGALLIPLLAGAVLHRHNLAEYPLGRLVTELGALALLAVTSCWMWLRPLYKRQPSYAVLRAVLLLALALPWVLPLLPAALPSANIETTAAGQLRHALGCFVFGCLTAMPALVVVAGLGRRSGGQPGFALLPALAAALAGVLGLELHCPEASPAHLFAGHAPVALALPFLGLLARLRRPEQRMAPR